MEKKKHQISNDKIKFVSSKTEKYSGADMENITNESAYLAIEKSKQIIDDEDFEEAFNKIRMEKENMLE